MDTDTLIRSLVEDCGPVKRLLSPIKRTALWFGISILYVAAMVLAYRLSGNEVTLSLGPRVLIEQIATILTAVSAAAAAFCYSVPGYDRRVAFLPLLPFSVWLLSIGESCVTSWLQLRAAGLSFSLGWECVPPSILIGVLPAVAMSVMLRRGAPLYPRVTISLGSLAVAALANLGLRLFHAGDATIVMLIWHLGACVIFFALACMAGPQIWPGQRYRFEAARAP